MVYTKPIKQECRLEENSKVREKEEEEVHFYEYSSRTHNGIHLVWNSPHLIFLFNFVLDFYAYSIMGFIFINSVLFQYLSQKCFKCYTFQKRFTSRVKWRTKKDEKSISPQLAVHMYCWRIFMSLPCKGAVTKLHNSTFHCIETNFMLSYKLIIHHWIQDQIYNICAYILCWNTFEKEIVFKTTITYHYWIFNHLEFLIDIWCFHIILLLSFQTIFAVFFFNKT